MSIFAGLQSSAAATTSAPAQPSAPLVDLMGASTPAPAAAQGSLDDLLGAAPKPQPNIYQSSAGQPAPDSLLGLMSAPASSAVGARAPGAAFEVGGLAGLGGEAGGRLGAAVGRVGTGGATAGMGGSGGILGDLGLGAATGVGLGESGGLLGSHETAAHQVSAHAPAAGSLFADLQSTSAAAGGAGAPRGGGGGDLFSSLGGGGYTSSGAWWLRVALFDVEPCG